MVPLTKNFPITLTIAVTFFGIISLATSSNAQETTQTEAPKIPADVAEELKSKPEAGPRLVTDLSEEAQVIRRNQLAKSMNPVMPTVPREQKNMIYNAMAASSGMSMRDLFNFMADKKKVAAGVTFDEVIESMEIKANEVNFKKTGHSKIWQDVGAISGLPTLRLEILHFCDAIVGRRMVDFSREFSIFIPCRISVVEEPNGDIWIMTLDWDVTWLSMAWQPGSLLPEDLKQDSVRIRDAMEQIMHAGASGEW